MVTRRILGEEVHPPVSTTELRDWCRIDDKQDEETLYGLSLAATLLIEQATGRSLAGRLYEFAFDPCGGPKFRIEAAPIIQIVNVLLRDEHGVTTPVALTEYNVSEGDTAWTFYMPGIAVPPGTQIIAEVETGYAGSAQVPAPLRHAIAVWVGAHYADREGGDIIAKAERTVASLIAPYRLSVL